MIYRCENLGFNFDMPDDNFVPLTNKDKIKIFNMNEQQLKQNLYTFVEVYNNRLTGKYFQITLDSGRYYTPEDVKTGQKLCVYNIKKYYPEFKLISESTIMPNNIKNCVFERPNGTKFSQYYMAKNTYMFCVSGEIEDMHDDLDNLMAFVCMSVKSEYSTDVGESQQNLVMEITKEANRLAKTGMPIKEAMDKAFEKFGIKKH